MRIAVNHPTGIPEAQSERCAGPRGHRTDVGTPCFSASVGSLSRLTGAGNAAFGLSGAPPPSPPESDGKPLCRETAGKRRFHRQVSGPARTRPKENLPQIGELLFPDPRNLPQTGEIGRSGENIFPRAKIGKNRDPVHRRTVPDKGGTGPNNGDATRIGTKGIPITSKTLTRAFPEARDLT